MKNKNNLVLTIIAIVTILVTVVGATFAYFGATVNTGSGSTLSTVVEENDVLFTATGSNMTMEITADKMTQHASKDGIIVAGDSSDSIMDVTLTVGTEKPIACTYNIYYQWDSAGTAYLTKTNGADKEFTAQLAFNDLNQNGTSGINYLKEETQLTDIITSANKTLVVKGASIVADSQNSGSQTWTPILKFYNLQSDQTALAGKTFSGKFTIDDVECGGIKNLSEEVIAQISNTDYTSSQDNTIYKVTRETVTHNSETLDAGVRYEGKDPDNYVTFNGESWRIIGTFEGSTIGLETNKQYTKIIKEKSIGFYSWSECINYDDEYEMCEESRDSDWENGILKLYLNGEYLNSLSDASKIARNNNEYSTWYLRGLDGEAHENSYTPDWYIFERYTGQTGYKDGVQYGASSETKAAIGLMYGSDYGYAAYGAACDNKSSMTLFNYGAGCAAVDWLSPRSDYYQEWLISPDPESFSDAFYTIEPGGIFYGYGAGAELAARPTLYLESTVGYANGDGSKASPYVLVTPESNPSLSSQIISKVSANDYTSSQDQTVYKIARETVEYNGQTLDAGVRYEGKDPDNYITFNGDEEWRIIGVFEGSTIGLEPGKQYTKIIKTISLDVYNWDCDDLNGDGDCFADGEQENDWENSTLNTYLNEEYLSGLDDSNKIARYIGKYSTWHLRGPANDYDDLYTQDWYVAERINGKAGYRNGIQYTAATEVQAAIGLMYPSDYGYAAYGTNCDNKLTSPLSTYGTIDWDTMEVTGCSTVDYLYENDTWLISPNPINSNYAFWIFAADGGFLEAAETDSSNDVKPVLYLEANVTATGSGTKLDPYVLN